MMAEGAGPDKRALKMGRCCVAGRRRATIAAYAVSPRP